MAKSPDDMLASMIANFPEKTGKPLDEWVRIAKAAKLAKHGEIVKHLKSEYGIGHGYANLVAHTALQGDAPCARQRRSRRRAIRGSQSGFATDL